MQLRQQGSFGREGIAASLGQKWLYNLLPPGPLIVLLHFRCRNLASYVGVEQPCAVNYLFDKIVRLYPHLQYTPVEGRVPNSDWYLWRWYF